MSIRLLLAFVGLAALAACDNAAPGEAPKVPDPPRPQIVSGAVAVEHAFVPSIDPVVMTDAEIARVVSAGRRCAFRYTEDSDPVLATDGARGVVKINGDLVALAPARAGGLTDIAAGGVLSADGVRLTVQPLPGEDTHVEGGRETWEANLRFEVARAPGLSVDYRGFYGCDVALRESRS